MLIPGDRPASAAVDWSRRPSRMGGGAGLAWRSQASLKALQLPLWECRLDPWLPTGGLEAVPKPPSELEPLSTKHPGTLVGSATASTQPPASSRLPWSQTRRSCAASRTTAPSEPQRPKQPNLFTLAAGLASGGASGVRMAPARPTRGLRRGASSKGLPAAQPIGPQISLSDLKCRPPAQRQGRSVATHHLSCRRTWPETRHLAWPGSEGQ
ncbi:hypothetical protein B0J13DRAFT_190927 [Dactylonectria estremocensis]|uniref:Uncharacterized protein n=1 Tax=Dactylonectria estremocensis TaxID=1079267 RepID=A0A9P9FCU1_9HYPO|nr:hypothetical protein B0J13DRAFT_190927 [Dactylonectria estremocensis]